MVAATRRVRVLAPVEGESQMSNGCPQVEALDRQTAALDRQTEMMSHLIETVKEAVETFKAPAEAIAKLGAAQEKFCQFIVKNRLKISLGIVSALVAVGAISPNAAGALKVILAGFGAAG